MILDILISDKSTFVRNQKRPKFFAINVLREYIESSVDGDRYLDVFLLEFDFLSECICDFTYLGWFINDA